ncbi:MAG: Patatin [Gammaproteobacteria bacterium]|nr:Patatin [Gammaproteobacteria bacterium]|tara:strand:- start:277 stop:1491 length:1215 start_codon:yes stop_codon:yes gene_type:complete
MKISSNSNKSALVLPGGGAQGAFQVGVLKAISEILPSTSVNPFSIVSGTSVGAINAVALASRAANLREGIMDLEKVWANFRCDQVYKTDNLTMVKTSVHWFLSIILGGWLVGTPKSLLDNSPLKELLVRNIKLSKIKESIEDGHLDAVAVTMAGFKSAYSKSFYEGSSDSSNWERIRRQGEKSTISFDHLMATVAVPMIFPPQKIGNEYFGDGAMRQATPLSPAIHLGADRILTIGIRNELSKKKNNDLVLPPSFGQIAGYVLDTLFMDSLYSDLERVSRINELIDLFSEKELIKKVKNLKPIDNMLIVPSEDLMEIAYRHRKKLPFSIRTLLRGVTGKSESENKLLSFLLFEKSFTRELIELGYMDAMNIKYELEAFVQNKKIPRLFAPEWIKKDMSCFTDNL